MTRLRMTVCIEYHVRDALNSYGTADPVEMAAIDQENCESDPQIITEMIQLACAENNNSCIIKVEPA